LKSSGKRFSQIQILIRQRANGLCEYCHTSEQWQYVRFTIDRVIPAVKGGTDNLDNLALACFHCNRRKSDRITAFDPESGEEVPLFNPRKNAWKDHFIWSDDGIQIIGVTAFGRATISTLDLNRNRVLNIRRADKMIGRHPPEGDPIKS
jgi:hypothetical protein